VLWDDPVPALFGEIYWVSFEKRICRAIGVNHHVWITEFQYNGKDAWLLVHAKMAEKPE
jgi:alpha-galactosidase/6-phospho-beta-glucosidase family protein